LSFNPVAFNHDKNPLKLSLRQLPFSRQHDPVFLLCYSQKISVCGSSVKNRIKTEHAQPHCQPSEIDIGYELHAGLRTLLR